jgi:hypothetical protein
MHDFAMRFLSFLAALTIVSAAARAQTRPSQLATVTQSIAQAHVEITYRRPVARGRALFGALVPWGQIWTPSADSGARFMTTSPLSINGSTLPAGTYSVWTIPDSASWTFIFNKNAVAFHKAYPGTGEVLRIRAAPHGGADYIETLMFAFPMVDADSARLELRWGTTVIPLSIRALP